MFKFGGRLRAVRDSSYSDPNFNGTFTFNSLDAYQITEQGIANGLTPAQIRAAGGGAGQFAITYGTPAVVVTYYDVGLYFSDDWRWKPNFTVSYGLRYETQTDIHDYGDVAPRVSFAWGLGKGALRRRRCCVLAGACSTTAFDEQYVLQADRLNGTTQQQVHCGPARLLSVRATARQPVAEYGEERFRRRTSLRPTCARHTRCRQR